MNLPEGFQVEIKPPEGFKVVSPKIDETKFQSDYKAYAEKSGLDTDPDNPKHFYDYRALYKDEGGFYPDEAGHLSSKYKLDGHPRMFVNGVNTKTGVPKGFTSEMPPAQLPDVARITRPAKEIDEINPIYFSTKEQLKYTYERLFSALFEKPLYAITELGLRGAKGVVQAGGKMPQLPAPKFVEDLDNSMREKAVGWLDKTINIYEHPEKYAPYTFEAETKRANYRAAWYQKSLAAGIGSDVIEACTDLGALMIQMSLMGKVVPTKTATAHIAKVGAHGFFTTSGDVQERAKAAMYRIAYNITPYVANATGATGFAAVATDTALNTFLTSPTYVQAYKQAGGFNDEFLSMVIPQFVMDIGMAWNTRGLPANQAKVKIDRYLANRPEATKLPKDEGVELIKDIQKAIVPKEEVKPEVKEQLIEGKIGEVKVEAPPKLTLSQRVENIRETYVRPETITRAEVKAVQSELIDIVKTSGIEAKDVAKFIKTIKNTQTQSQLNKITQEVENRIIRYQQAAERIDITNAIDKELKYTKPVKAGARVVGKYDYESNKHFDDIRNYNKLNQTKAQEALDMMPTEGLDELGLIKTRMLSLKANGAKASVELHRQVIKDIKMLKALGAAAKDDADFDARVNRQEKVDEALSSIARVKHGMPVVSKIKDAYVKGFANIHSAYNAIFGKAFADKYNPELKEGKRNTNIYYTTKEIGDRISKILETKNILRAFESMAKEKYELNDKEGLVFDINKGHLIDIYNSLKNPVVRDRYYDAFGKEQIEYLMGFLSPQERLVGDELQRTVQSYREVLNERHIETTGRDLGFVENYWPSTSEYQPSVYDDVRLQGETPSAMKERAKGKVIPRPDNAWHKFQRHVVQAEHVSNLSREYETLKRILTNRKIKNAISKKFGKDTPKFLLEQLDNISLNAQMRKVDAVSSMFGKALNNWIIAKLPSPSIFVRQLMSVGNYMEVMPADKWTGTFIKGVATPKKTFDFMWKNAPFLEARFHKGYKESLARAIDDAERISANKSSWTKGLTALVRAGDIGAIIYGGYPVVKYEMSQGKSLKEAVKAFEDATYRSQQAGLSSSLSQYQNSRNPMAKLFLAFKNTSTQYLRKMADATISYRNNDIDANQYIKTMTIYGVIQPTLYTMAGWGVKKGMQKAGELITGNASDKKDDDLLDDILIQMVAGPVNAVPVFNDIIKYSMRRLMDKPTYKVLGTPMLDDVESAMRKATKKEPTLEDWLYATGVALEVTTATPVLSFKRMYDYLFPKKKTKQRF